MFDIGFFELLIIAVVALIVLGPERLPRAAQFAGLWVRKARAQWYSVKSEFERELAAEEMRRSVAAPVEELRREVAAPVEELRRDVADVKATLQDAAGATDDVRDELRASAAAVRDVADTPAPTADDAGTPADAAEPDSASPTQPSLFRDAS